MSCTKVLVYGWYHQDNLGDDLFKEAFRHLFPDIQFTFVNQITTHDLSKTDAVFIGGGSLLDNDLIREPETLQPLQDKKLLYLGVGAETDFHPIHQQLLPKARLIATRSANNTLKFQELNPNVMAIPDLAYSLSVPKPLPKIKRSILVIPNIMVVPSWEEPQWKHVAWNYFKSEFSQFLDTLTEQEFVIHFLPLCTNRKLNDISAAIEIINATQHRDKYTVLHQPIESQDALQTISMYELVMTQRYHGIVLSDIAQARYISIYHHDKLKNSAGINLSYYGLTKSQLLNSVVKAKVSSALPIDSNIFIELRRRVYGALRGD